MNDLQIDYFMAVATNLSFTKTSEELFVSQPAISKQISLLEKELGVKLFTRNNKKTKLTDAGELFYDFFRRYKLELRNTIQEAQQMENKVPESITIGFLEGWDLANFIPEVLDRFHQRYPDTHVTINCCGVKELSTLLLTGGIDLALTMKNSLMDFQEVSLEDVAEIEKILLYSANSRYGMMENVDLATFRKETFFAPWEIVEKMITQLLDTYCEPYGFRPNIEFVHNNESMITCVRNGLGVAILDEWCWCKDAQELKYIPIHLKDTVIVAKIDKNASEPTQFAAQVLAETVRKFVQS